jgi:predicted phage-related endonuclease
LQSRSQSNLKERFKAANKGLKQNWNQAKKEFGDDFKNMKSDLSAEPSIKENENKQKTAEKSDKNGFIVFIEAIWLMALSAPIFIIGILASIFGIFLLWELFKMIF